MKKKRLIHRTITTKMTTILPMTVPERADQVARLLHRTLALLKASLAPKAVVINHQIAAIIIKAVVVVDLVVTVNRLAIMRTF